MPESAPAPDTLQKQIDALARRLEAVEQENRELRRENKKLREVRKLDAETIQHQEREKQDLRRRTDHFMRVGEEVTSQLEYEPGRLFRHRIVRPRYVRA